MFQDCHEEFNFFNILVDEDTNFHFQKFFSPRLPQIRPKNFMDLQTPQKSELELLGDNEAFFLLKPFDLNQDIGSEIENSQQENVEMGCFEQIVMKRCAENFDAPAEELVCSCNRSKCLKLYCICLQRGKTCGPHCHCVDCQNDQAHEHIREEVLAGEKFKNLFQGCKCKRSKCQQKYCECHLNGKKCDAACKCKSCKNK